MAWDTSRGENACPRAAFTATELMVVMAIIAVLAALILPVLARARGGAKTTSCLNNFKELTLAWTIYAGDNREYLVNNDTDGNAICGPDALVSSGFQAGVGGWTGNARTDTNDLGILRGALFPYNGEAAIYHCPADPSHCAKAPGLLRLRSVSMSTGMHWHNSNQDNPTNGSFAKLTEIIRPRPRFASVFLDEAANSIDNNAIGIYGGTCDNAGGNIDPTKGNYRYWNVPASRHDNGGVLSFADGHAEYWRWLDPWIPAANALPDGLPAHDGGAPARDVPTEPGDRDLQRLKMTVPAAPASDE